MKTLLFFIFIAFTTYIYFNFVKENNIEVKDHLVYTSSTSFSSDDFSYSSEKSAYIEGRLNNISKKYLTNIILTYVIGIDTVSTYIPRLSPDESINFRTNSFIVRDLNYKYDLDDIKYDFETTTNQP
ncbi:MAG TPA: hypothetical protein VFF33_04685 [Ignavibacteriaceae bacterium]|nr:hypothetical protein [Ignavibacteriaceae bacterium]